MIQSQESTFSQAQSVTATGTSTNICRLPEHLPWGTPVRTRIQVVKAPDSTLAARTFTVQIRTAAKTTATTVVGVTVYTLTSPTVVVSSAGYLHAALVLGFTFELDFMPNSEHRYFDLNFAISGSGTLTAAQAPSITAFIPMGVDHWVPMVVGNVQTSNYGNPSA